MPSTKAQSRLFEKSLTRLPLDCLDLYLIYQPHGDVYGSWRAMEELHGEGKTGAIGVCNLQPDRLVDLIVHNKVVPAVNRVEVHPFCQQTEVHPFMQENKVQIEAWRPFSEGRNNIFENEVLRSIGGKHNKSGAQVILRWLVQRDVIAIPKTVRQDRMVENSSVFDFALRPEEMYAILALDTGASLFLDYRDPETLKRLGNAGLNI